MNPLNDNDQDKTFTPLIEAEQDGTDCERRGRRKRRAERSLELIANFRDGYAKDWYFAVGEWFKDQLDIKYTVRKEDDKRVMRWTQGIYYCFDEGHVIYDARVQRLPTWADMIKHIKIACTIIRATPNTINENKQFILGQVNFQLDQPREDRTGLELIGHYNLSQSEFVDFLRTGMLHGQHVTQRLRRRK